MLPPRGGGGRGYSSLSMKPTRLFLFALSVLASSTTLFAAIVQFGSTSQTAWTATAADGCDMGSTVTLHGVKVTLGSPADVGNHWTWHAGNTGLLPSQMPSTDGTAETLITTFAEAAPFGTLPTRGCFLKIEDHQRQALGQCRTAAGLRNGQQGCPRNHPRCEGHTLRRFCHIVELRYRCQPHLLFLPAQLPWKAQWLPLHTACVSL